jgi:TM2 domain-containing membrane protein YozV
MAEPVCPYCRMPFDDASPPRIFCTSCGMPHHEDCYRENGGCTVFGCKCAPADDPKLQVSQSDLSAVSMPAQQYVPAAQHPAPVQQYQPSRYGGPLGLSQAAAAAPAQMAAPIPRPTVAPAGYPYAAAPLYGRAHKSRTTYIVLGIFLGAFGIHNFYAGYVGRGVAQLFLTVLALLTLSYLAIASWLWAIVEICIEEKDSTGLNFS